MFVTRIEATGFAGLSRAPIALERVTALDGPPRARVALADALCLGFAAWDADLLRDLLARWGCAEVEVQGADLPEGAQWARAPGLGAVLDGGPETLLTVALTVALDPPLYGRLRKEAARDPRLVDALADGAELVLRVGARFTPALDAMALDALGFEVGGVAFAVGGADRPAWLTPFLRQLRGRACRGPIRPRRWTDAAGGWDAGAQRALRRSLDALRGPPARVGDVVVTAEGPAVLDGEQVVPLARYGAAAERAAGVVGAVFLSGAEILLLEDPPRGWTRWLSTQALAEGSPLEQVLLIGAPGGAWIG